jgi:hypothetical protein
MHLLSYIDISRKMPFASGDAHSAMRNEERGIPRCRSGCPVWQPFRECFAHILALSERPNAYWHSRVRPMLPVVLLCCQPLTQLVQFDGVIVENKTSDC